MADSRISPQGVINIQQEFERSRLEKAFLASAYERVVPIRRYPTGAGQHVQRIIASAERVLPQLTAGVGT